MSFLQLNQLQKFFGNIQVIKSVNLEINAGEFVVFVGPSGCGKSTLLRLIAGLEYLNEGSIVLEGRDISHTPAAKRDLAMVFQSYALYPHMSVRDNLGFALRIAKRPPAEIQEKIERAAAILDLHPYLDRLPKELSGGQRQRVAIGRAIVRSPKIFLFDEPLSNLDAALRGQTRVEIANLHRDLKTTTIYVTHDQVEAMTLADRVVVLRGGVIEQVGTPLQLYDHPANVFVAQFIGTPQMNIIPATQFENAEQHLGKSIADDMSIGIRPEHISVANNNSDNNNGMPARVSFIEALGAETLIYLKTNSDATLIARQQARATFTQGDEVRLNFNHPALHLFDKDGNATPQ